MPAQILLFQPWIQEPLEAGVLSPASAWMLELEITELAHLPWSPGMRELSQRVLLFHHQRLEAELQRMQ